MNTPLERSLARYIWATTRPQQTWILCIVLLSMIPYFMAFDLPKQIVNGPLQGDGFETAGATQTFMDISFNLPWLGQVTLFPGVELDRLSTLYALSFVFLGLVIVNGLFKFYINTYKGRLGERLLRRIRFDLVDRVLRFPPATFKKVKGAEIASMVKDEVEPLGGFTGEAFVSPLFLGGQAVTALAFIFMQNLMLGLLTAGLVSAQALLIPRLRRRLLVLGRERQLTAREFAGRVGEIVEGIGTIHAYDTSNYERADVAHRLGRIFRIRYDIYQWKYLVKFINNFLASVTPFLFYLVGGILTLRGHLDLGQLVAVIGAYKDLPGPLKELIDWDQQRQDVEVKYQQVVGQFDVDPLIAPDLHALAPEAPEADFSQLALSNLTVSDDGGSVLLNHVSLRFQPAERVALYGLGASGADVLAEALGRQVWPTTGRITVGEQDLLALPESVTGRAITYVPSDPYYFYGTLEENLLYGLKHAPLTESREDPNAKYSRAWEKREARSANTPYFDRGADWVDYGAAGISGADDLGALLRPIFEATELTDDIINFAMHTTFPAAHLGEMAERIVSVRAKLLPTLEAAGLKGAVLPYDPATYNPEATVAENLLFGNATGVRLAPENVSHETYFRSLVIETGLNKALFEMGRRIAEATIDLFGDLPEDHPFFHDLTYMTHAEIPIYRQILKRVEGKSVQEASDEDRAALIGRLAGAYVEPRYRFGLLDDELRDRIVSFRKLFRERLPDYLKGEIEFYDPERYMDSANLLVNLLFGRLDSRLSKTSFRQARGVLRKLLRDEGLGTRVLMLGLEYHVGSGGRRLSPVQRQKIGLARALVRQSAYFVFNRPVTAMDSRLQSSIMKNVLALLNERDAPPGVLWVLSDHGELDLFDRVVVLESGRLVEDGSTAEVASADHTSGGLLTA
ncbi:ABC transporter ATP-binding protein/permease [Acidimangrovimonas sediminis]|uniref:ABC transporter ATP-binding protein/permease n=1 Tax=Acidimangrovimonas sediminis TaxID=2056283 RepID=UPI000C807BDB|nr:ABC transporter ATP-binding protein/permease [Acidimangrovimonas sediminis]